MKYKVYWRKAGIKPEMGSKFLDLVNQKKPKNFLEIGVYTGVNARNVCDLQSKLFSNDFGYLGMAVSNDPTANLVLTLASGTGFIMVELAKQGTFTSQY